MRNNCHRHPFVTGRRRAFLAIVIN